MNHPADGNQPTQPQSPFSLAAVLIVWALVVIAAGVGVLKLVEAVVT